MDLWIESEVRVRRTKLLAEAARARQVRQYESGRSFRIHLVAAIARRPFSLRLYALIKY